MAHHRTVEVWYDGQCPLCRASRDWCAARDPDGRLEFRDISTAPDAELPVGRGPQRPPGCHRRVAPAAHELLGLIRAYEAGVAARPWGSGAIDPAIHPPATHRLIDVDELDVALREQVYRRQFRREKFVLRNQHLEIACDALLELQAREPGEFAQRYDALLLPRDLIDLFL